MQPEISKQRARSGSEFAFAHLFPQVRPEVEAQESIGSDVAVKLVNYLDTGSTVGSLTVPDLHLPVMQDTHRLLHIHRNQPGVLSAINAVFSEQRINVAGQYLQTNPRIGYVVMDVEGEREASLKLRKRLDEVPGTIRTRILY